MKDFQTTSWYFGYISKDVSQLIRKCFLTLSRNRCLAALPINRQIEFSTCRCKGWPSLRTKCISCLIHLWNWLLTAANTKCSSRYSTIFLFKYSENTKRTTCEHWSIIDGYCPSGNVAVNCMKDNSAACLILVMQWLLFVVQQSKLHEPFSQDQQLPWEL